LRFASRLSNQPVTIERRMGKGRRRGEAGRATTRDTGGKPAQSGGAVDSGAQGGANEQGGMFAEEGEGMQDSPGSAR
jgi:hypothetical protein